MNVRKIVKNAISEVKKIPYKFLYGQRLCIGKDQKWGSKTKIVVGKSGELTIGNSFEARRFDYLNVQSGVLKIGNYVFLNQNVSITCLDNIEIGSNVIIANNVVIVDHDHDYINGGFTSRPVKIGNHVWIGANVVILKGISIGDGAVIAAGSVVNEDIPDNALAAGTPAKIVKTIKR